jgi:hypothetical protein
MKQTKSKGKTYGYYYVENHLGSKTKWCYLGKFEGLPKEYQLKIRKNQQTDTQNRLSLENLNLGSFPENRQGGMRAGRLAWLGHWLYEPKVAGSSPVRPTTKPCHSLIHGCSLN